MVVVSTGNIQNILRLFNGRRKLASLEEQNRELISVNAKREEALQQTTVCD